MMEIKKHLKLATCASLLLLGTTVFVSENTEAYNLMNFSFADQHDLGDVKYYISEEHYEEGTEAYEWVIEGVEAWNVVPEVNITRVDDEYEANVIITTSSDMPVFTNGQKLYGIANRELVIIYDRLIEDEETYITTVTHEFGHSLGLGHTHAEGSVMNTYIDSSLEITDDDFEGLAANFEKQQDLEQQLSDNTAYENYLYYDITPKFEVIDEYVGQEHIAVEFLPVYNGIPFNPFEQFRFDYYQAMIPTSDIFFEPNEIVSVGSGETLNFEKTTYEDGTEVYILDFMTYEDMGEVIFIGNETDLSEEEYSELVAKERSDALWVRQQLMSMELIDTLYSHLELENPEELGVDPEENADRPEVTLRNFDPVISEDDRNLESYREVFVPAFEEERNGELELIATVEDINYSEETHGVTSTIRGYDVFKFHDTDGWLDHQTNADDELMIVVLDMVVENTTDVNVFTSKVAEIMFEDEYSTAIASSSYTPSDLSFEEMIGEAEYRFVPGVDEFPLILMVNGDQMDYFNENGASLIIGRNFGFHGDQSVRTGGSRPFQFVLDKADIVEEPYYMDVISAKKKADKEVIDEYHPEETVSVEGVEITVSGVQVAEVTPTPGNEGDFNEGDVAVTVQLDVTNNTESLIADGDLRMLMMIDGEQYDLPMFYGYDQIVESNTEGTMNIAYLVPKETFENAGEVLLQIESLYNDERDRLISWENPVDPINITQ